MEVTLEVIGITKLGSGPRTWRRGAATEDIETDLGSINSLLNKSVK